MSRVATLKRTWPSDRPELIPFLPLLHSVWTDGVLSPEELSALRTSIDAQDWLEPAAGDALSVWLDPADPPTPSELERIAARIRAATLPDDPAATSSLTDLGLALWRAEGGAQCCWTDPASVKTLRALEASLGVLGAEAARGMARPSTPTVAEPSSTGLDTAAAATFLAGDRAELRSRVLELLQRPELMIPSGLLYHEQRARTLAAVHLIADEGLGRLGFPEEFGGSGDPAGAVAVFETLAFGDLSVVVKFGVQFGLFGGSVLQLGTEKHHRAYLERIGRMELPGCYAMTETLHGSNVRDLETTATYDHDSDTLLVHTPSEGAGKDYIGNAAQDGQVATVFARLLVQGEDHGVHAVLVPIRNPDGDLAQGIRIEDRGYKIGLNGVDNGRIWFDNVRVPRANLLDRFATIEDDGSYHSPIASSGRRFFTMLRTLVAGRVSVAAAALSATKVGLAIAVRYADTRRQFGPKGGEECSILDYPAVQRELLPALATTFGLHFAIRALQADYAVGDPADEARLEASAAGLKAYASTHCVVTLQACREACGGQGYIAENGLASLKADTDIFTTFEGANAVLYQLVAKGLLSQFRDEMGELNVWRAMKYLGDRTEIALTKLNPVAVRRTDAEHLRDPGFQRAALAYREERLTRSAARRLRSRLQDGGDSFLAVTEIQDHLIALARAHVERTILDHFYDAVAAAPDVALSEALRSLASLYALARIEADRGWFLESGFLESNKSQAVRKEVAGLCDEVRDLAPALVDAFGIPEPLLPTLVRR